MTLCNVASTSMQRHGVASTLRRRCKSIICPHGSNHQRSYPIYIYMILGDLFVDFKVAKRFYKQPEGSGYMEKGYTSKGNNSAMEMFSSFLLCRHSYKGEKTLLPLRTNSFR